MVKKDKGKADEDILNLLHGLIAKELINKIKTGEASVQDINAAIKFLKDNNVTADIEFNESIKILEDTVTNIIDLPFDGGDNECPN